MHEWSTRYFPLPHVRYLGKRLELEVDEVAWVWTGGKKDNDAAQRDETCAQRYRETFPHESTEIPARNAVVEVCFDPQGDGVHEHREEEVLWYR